MDLFMEHMKMEAAQKKQIYHDLNRSARTGQIVMAGSSLMEQFPINELLMSMGIHTIVYNRGLGGFTTGEYLEALNECVLEPERFSSTSEPMTSASRTAGRRL